jgi:protoheme IX farnesyltransferase
MKRTQHRPIPSGRVTPGDALNFGIILSLFSVMMLGIATNWMAAGLLASAILFYVCIYTMWLKRSTPQNIVIGGVAGAFPPLIGWVVMTGDISLFPLLLFGITFVWTPPHFWALALYRNEDYQKAKVPMLPVVSGEAATKRQIVLYSWGLFAFTLSPVLLGYAHTLYLAGAFLLGVIFVGLAHKVKHAKHYGPAKQLFGYSILYLFLIYGLFVIDAWVSIMLPY